MNEDFFTLVYNNEEIKLLLKKGDNLLAFGKALLPPQTVSEGKINRPRVFARTLNELRKKTTPRAIVSNLVVAALPEEKVFIQVLELPKVPDEKILETIKWQAEKLLSFPLEVSFP